MRKGDTDTVFFPLLIFCQLSFNLNSICIYLLLYEKIKLKWMRKWKDDGLCVEIEGGKMTRGVQRSVIDVKSWERN